MKINLCAHRRLNLQHKTDEHFRAQQHRSELQFHRHREQIFQRKLDRLRKNVERVELNVPNDENENGDEDDDDDEDEPTLDEKFLKTNCLSRIQNHYRLLNFSAQTEQRLLNPLSTSPKSSKEELSESLPHVQRKKSTNGVEPIPLQRRASSYQSRSARMFSSASTRNDLEEKTFQSYIDQQLYDERKKQRHQNERKGFLLKDFDELKHSIEDPHATLSVLAALSRALLFLESETD